jgi:hypothetical protein
MDTTKSRAWLRALRALLAVPLLAAWMAGCEPQRAEMLAEDVSTEEDVRRMFGEPKTVTVGADGTRTLEYPRQPEGYANYIMVIGTNGKLSSLRQLLNPDNFAKVTPGLDREAVRRILGPHARERRFELKKETLVEWRFRDGQEAKIFGVTFGPDGLVTGTAITADQRELEPNR